MNWIDRLLIALSCSACLFIWSCGAPKKTQLTKTLAPPHAEHEADSWPEAVVAESCRRFEAGMAALDLGQRREAYALLDEAVLLILEQDAAVRRMDPVQSHLHFLIATIHQANIDDAAFIEIPEEDADGATLERLLAGSLTEDLIAHIDEHTTAEPQAPESDFPMVHNAAVDRLIFEFTHDKAPMIAAALERSTAYVDRIRETFGDLGIPQDLCYLPLIESGFKTGARSRVRATGMWQFMTGTGRDFGLNITWWEDQRLDPFFSTEAAGRYLKFLYTSFDDWYLALAAYNAGPGRIRSAIRRGKTRDFWKLARRRLIPRETIGYIPAFLASIKIAKDPDNYGFFDLIYHPPAVFSEVEVDFCIDLEVLAEALGLESRVLADLNPALLRGITPGSGTPYRLRFPAGRDEEIRLALDRIPPEKRLKIRHYQVKKGDTLSTIARRFGTSLPALTSLNGIRNPRRLQIGQNLVIPLGPAVATAAGLLPDAAQLNARQIHHRIRPGDTLYALAQRYQTSISSILQNNPTIDPMALRPGQTLTLSQGDRWQHGSSRSSGHGNRYRVRKGDSLSVIAMRFRTSPSRLARTSRISVDSILQIGQILEIPTDHPLPETSYTVQKGDTLWDIARRFSVTVDDLSRWNQISPTQPIRPGDILRILPH